MQQITIKRLNKEQLDLEKNPLENILVARNEFLQYHFVLYNLPYPYEGGFYHGLLKLADNYPFGPPTLTVYTPSGRFSPGSRICTTFTDFHKEQWASGAWTIRNMLIATVSFMLGSQYGTGCVKDSIQQKKQYARNSMKWNIKQPIFIKLFGNKLKEKGLWVNNQTEQQRQLENSIVSENKMQIKNKQSCTLYAVLVLLIAFYILWKLTNQ